LQNYKLNLFFVIFEVVVSKIEMIGPDAGFFKYVIPGVWKIKQKILEWLLFLKQSGDHRTPKKLLKFNMRRRKKMGFTKIFVTKKKNGAQKNQKTIGMTFIFEIKWGPQDFRKITEKLILLKQYGVFKKIIEN